MSADIDYSGLTLIAAGVRKAASGSLQKELVAVLHKAAPKIEGDIKGGTFTRIQRRAAATVQATPDSKGIIIRGGGGGSLGGVLFDGGEYGGRKPRKVAYATRSRLGKAYVVRRRTTMQFLPHLGRRGYFYWPTIREWMPKIETGMGEAVEKAIGVR